MHQDQKPPGTLRIGAGASYAGDRIEPAADLAHRGQLDYLVFETLAERTIALAQLERLKDPAKGFNALLGARLRAVWPAAVAAGTRIVSSMGAANPLGAARHAAAVAGELGLPGLSIAAVLGDDVLDYCRAHADELLLMESGQPLSSVAGQMVSANAYLGADAIVPALAQGADLVLTGRVADCSLFLAPMIHHYGWSWDDWALLGQGQVCADMLECGANVSGGFFADPGYKYVPNLGALGYPYVDIDSAGIGVIGKLAGTGGLISRATCSEQMLYEIHDPSAYVTPDVIVDFTSVSLTEIGPDRVRITGGRGRARPALLKVSVGLREGWIGEAEITYAGLGCVARARLAEEVVRQRLDLAGVQIAELRVDYIGINSLHGQASHPTGVDPYEVRLRFAGRCRERKDADLLVGEVETLVGKGPCASSLPRLYVREVIAIESVLIPRSAVSPQVVMFGGDRDG